MHNYYHKYITYKKKYLDLHKEIIMEGGGIKISQKETIEQIEDYLKKIKYKFKEKPLVVGGLALQYYGIRKTGHDFDAMVSEKDWQVLKKKYPKKINLFGGKKETDIDATINLKDIEVDLIKTLYQYDYDFMSEHAVEHTKFKVASPEKLFLVKALPSIQKKHPKSIRDANLLVKYILKKQY